ncbi:MAG: hypothetical protein P1V20_06860 [Verrucomicrobiales bacterium]|nr:hypothetical protein [Verrucomicrobiales bacterium]
MDTCNTIAFLTPKILEGVASGLLLAAIFWISGLFMTWFRSRSTDVATLRKYERLRAKVEVLSSLARIQTSDQAGNIDERKDILIKNELNLLLEELESEVAGNDVTTENTATPKQSKHFGFAQIARPLQLGPSGGFFPWLLKVFFWISLFLLTLMLIFTIAVNISPKGFLMTGYYDATNTWIQKDSPGNWNQDTKQWEPWTENEIREQVSIMKSGFTGVFVFQLFCCLFFWGIAKLAHRKKKPTSSAPPPLQVKPGTA